MLNTPQKRIKMNMNVKDAVRLEKHSWLVDIADQKSFIDVGGLWGTVNEMVTISALAGASKYAMADIQVEDHELWSAFDVRCEERGVKDYQKIITDICDEVEVNKLPKFDIVHCSGIIYHVSDPIQFIQNLASISNDYVMIGSMTIPENITNKAGSLDTPTGTAHLIPAIQDSTRAILEEYFLECKIRPQVAERKDYAALFKPSRRVKTGPWWWVYTPATLRSFAEVCDLEVVAEHTSNNGLYSDIMCRVGS